MRRLLENGANSSFVNKLADDKTPLDQIVFDPTERIAALTSKPHPKIPSPENIYGNWKNSLGLDLSNDHVLAEVKRRMDSEIAGASSWKAAPIINGDVRTNNSAEPRFSPNNQSESLGQVCKPKRMMWKKPSLPPPPDSMPGQTPPLPNAPPF